MVVQIYHGPACSPCRAVLMCARELNVEVQLHEVDVLGQETLCPRFLKMNPQHCVPTIDDGGFYLWESRAIIAYLANKYAPDSSLYPKDPQKRAIVDRLLYFDVGTLYKAQGDYIYPQLFGGAPADPDKEATYKKALNLLNDQLEKTPYVAGSERTLADLSILASLTFMELVDYDLSPYPKITAWISKLKSELPYYDEINDKPLKTFKEILKSKMSR